jgi:hypothetical protein
VTGVLIMPVLGSRIVPVRGLVVRAMLVAAVLVRRVPIVCRIHHLP